MMLQVTAVDWWSYAMTNPLLTTLMLSLALGMIIVVVWLVLYFLRRQENEDQQDFYDDIYYQLHQQQIMDMQADRAIRVEYARAYTSMLNALATNLWLQNSLLASNLGQEAVNTLKELKALDLFDVRQNANTQAQPQKAP